MKPRISIGIYFQLSLITILLSILPVFPHPSHRRPTSLPSSPEESHVWRRQAATTPGNITSEVLQMIRDALNISDPTCANCSDLKKENLELKKEIEKPMAKNLRPAYSCDKWENKSRTCWLDRNVGDTVTFVLAFSEGANPRVQWKQEFYVLNEKKRRHYVIDPDNPMWNVVIGSRGHEMRLSPITEMDVDCNSFTATIVRDKAATEHKTQTLTYRIRVMPQDMGFVYPGETLMLNMKSVDLPPTSMRFRWYLEKEGGEERTLPSNMKLSPSGSVLTIMELRKEQEGVLACSVYTNTGFFATKKRFLIKEINQSNNQLMFEPTRPSSIRRQKRQLDPKENGPDSNWDFGMSSNRIYANDDDSMDLSRNVRSDENRQLSSKIQQDDYDSGDVDSPNKYQEENSQSLEEGPIDALAPRRGISERQASSNQATVPNDDIPQDGNSQQEYQQSGPESPMDRQQSQSGQVVLEVERKPDIAHINAMDRFSQMISTCDSDLHCSSDASCIKRGPDPSGFCRCNSGFQGNGIFCWEENQIQNSAIFSGEQQPAAENSLMKSQLQDSDVYSGRTQMMGDSLKPQQQNSRSDTN